MHNGTDISHSAFLNYPHVALCQLMLSSLRSYIRGSTSISSQCAAVYTYLYTHRAMSGIYFGPWELNIGQIFYESELSLGIVNLKPIVPGHVLIIPKRVCARFGDLTPEEVTDLYLSVHRVGPILERHYNAQALNIAMQDGAASGQSVPHVHVHILPRKQGDYKRNDDIYEQIDNHDAGIDFTRERLPRSIEEMTAESDELKPLFL